MITEAGTFSLLSYKVDSTNGGCENFTGYFLPQFTADRAARGSGNGPEVDPYDREAPIDDSMSATDEEECGTASRS